MKIQETYNESKNKFLFNDSSIFSNLRKNLINDFILSPKIKKNNESLKYLDPNILNFIYKYKNVSNKILFTANQKDEFKINVIDGKISNVLGQNKSNVDVKIDNINNLNNSVMEKFIHFQNYFSNDFIMNINSIMLNSGYSIQIPKNKNAKIFISNSVSEDGLTIFQKNIITCSKNSKVIIIEESTFDKISNNNIVNFFEVEEGAEVTHLIFQKNQSKANLQATSFANCKKNSKYKQFILNISKESVRNHHYVNLLGEDILAELDGIFFGSKNQYIDNKTQINHNFPNCESSQRYKGILTDNSKASYLSKTFVDKIAQKTKAYQLSRGILLSDDSYFHSKPELKIFADDVKCSHGSTIGPIDKDLLFYLRSRGLSKKISTSMLIKSFFHDIISDTHDKSFIEKFNYYSNIWLSENKI